MSVVGGNGSGKSAGLLLSYHASLPLGPVIILSAGFVYFSQSLLAFAAYFVRAYCAPALELSLHRKYHEEPDKSHR